MKMGQTIMWHALAQRPIGIFSMTYWWFQSFKPLWRMDHRQPPHETRRVRLDPVDPDCTLPKQPVVPSKSWSQIRNHASSTLI